MIRKTILTLATVFAVALGCFAAEVDDVKAFFNAYVNAANTYSKEIPNYYFSGEEYYLIIPRYEDMEVRLYRNDMEEKICNMMF